MMNIPNSFRSHTEDYLTLPVLKTFGHANKLDTTEDKYELIDSIQKFANINAENEEKVLQWLDDILKEGTKHIFIQKAIIARNITREKEYWVDLIKKGFNYNRYNYLAKSVSVNYFKLQSYKLVLNGEGVINSINFIFTILLHETKGADLTPDKIIYPIFLDLDLDNGYITGRCKSKANVYKIVSEASSDREGERVTAFNIFKELNEYTKRIMGYSFETKDRSVHRFKSKLYTILDTCTKTPIEINSKLISQKKTIEEFILEFMGKFNIDIAMNNNFNYAYADLHNFMEKYISINYEDKSIFTKDRFAYPVKISATDTDLASVEETSYDYKPLQSSPVFYDNKKIIEREKKCDSFSLMFIREKKTYFTSKPYMVKFDIKQGFCVLQFSSYVLEEEIQNVLSKIIGN